MFLVDDITVDRTNSRYGSVIDSGMENVAGQDSADL
jgi:hypothetical protein